MVYKLLTYVCHPSIYDAYSSEFAMEKILYYAHAVSALHALGFYIHILNTISFPLQICYCMHMNNKISNICLKFEANIFLKSTSVLKDGRNGISLRLRNRRRPARNSADSKEKN